MKPLDLASTFVVLEPDRSAVPVAVTPTIWQDLDRDFGSFKGRALVSCFSFDCDWETWEMHPAGDEVVCCVDGSMTLHQQLPGGGEKTVHLGPGDYAINPPGAWHTADCDAPVTAFFITPGWGTQHRPR